MTPRTTTSARRFRRSSTFVALSAAALLAASCGTGEDSPAAQGEVTPQSDTSTEVADSDEGEQFAIADLVTPEGEPRGTVEFAEVGGGTMVTAKAMDLPPGFHGLHIHRGAACSGTTEMPFADADGHFDIAGCPHPAHAGDLPPLLADSRGRAWCALFTDRFTVEEVVGRTVIVHAEADDFTTQPSGGAGTMIACGIIRRKSGAGHGCTTGGNMVK